MIKKVFENASKTTLILSLIAICFATSARAQGDGTTASTSTPAANKTLSPKEELMNKLRSSLKNPAEYVVVLAEYLNKYPYDVSTTSYIYSLSGPFKNEKNPETARNVINQLVKNTEQLPAPLKADIYRVSANVLFNN